jgi:hypothetical protein
MKLLRLIPILLLTACASSTHGRKIAVSTIQPRGQLVSATTLRIPEQIKEYRFGRYVDPADPLVMYESHPVYRIETSATWNLNPGAATMPPLRIPLAASNTSSHDAIIAEVNKQRTATRDFTDEIVKLNQRLVEMSQAVAQTRDLAKQNLDLQSQIAAIRDRLDALDSQIQSNKPAAPDASPVPDRW